MAHRGSFAPAYHREFTSQRAGAKYRNIEWNLTYKEWLQWWRETGKLNQRGSHEGCFVMGRINDKGPYALDNIECTEHSVNSVPYSNPKRRIMDKARNANQE